MSEGHLRLVSLSILGGPLHGRRHNPDEVVAEILIGSDTDCHLVVELPGISPIHAKVWADLNESTVYDTSAPNGVYLNTERVVDKAVIGEGDVLWLGPPQQPDSVCVKLHFEPWLEVLPTVPVESYEVDDAVVIGEDDAIGEDAAASTQAVTPEMIPSEAPPEPATEVDVVEAVEAVEAEPVVESGAAFLGEPPTLVEPVAPAREEQAFFIGESEPSAAVAEAKPSPPAAEDWAITTEQPAGEPLAVPAPAADEFFVAGEPEAAADAAPTFIDADPVPQASTSEPEARAAPAPFLDLPPLEPPAPVVPLAPPAPAPAPPSPAPAPKPAAPAPKPAAPAAKPAAPAAKPAAPAAPATGTPAAAPAPTEAAAPAAARTPVARRAAAAPPPPAARRPAPAKPAPARRPAAARSAARAAGGPTWLRPLGLGIGGLLLVAAIGFGVSKLLFASVRLDTVEPTRVRVGQRAVLTGSGFGSDPSAQTVIFGDREARVLQASPTRLEVEVPEAVAEAGSESRVAVVVRAKGRTSGVVDVTVFQGPRLHGISPGAAMPGEEVMLAGAGWGIGATVQFGSVPASILEVQATQIRAVVPELPGGPGTEASVVVTVGGVESNPAPFILGHLPVLSGLNPASAAPGDIVSASGRGFEQDPTRNDVRIDGVPALVIASSNESLQLIVPRVGPGEAARTVELRVPGNANVGQAVLQLQPPADPIGFRFVAEPFTPASGRVHALLATGFGPAFVLSASGGRTAAERAAVAADRLNSAAQPLRTTVGLTLEARGLDSNPVIGLVGQPEALLEVTAEDAAAYNEDWTGLKGRGGPVSRARLARWWEALARDLVLLTIRAQAPRYAAALAPEGRALVQLFEAAQRGGTTGVPRRLVDEARPPLHDGLRLLGLRVPASVGEPATATAAAAALPAAAATPTPPPLELDGSWGGAQVEQGQRQYLTVMIRGGGGTVAFEGGITFTVPMLSLEKLRRDQVRFSLQIRGGVRHYAGSWDGEAIRGNVSTDGAGKNVVATFELRRR